jgi:hypothetical protein
MTASHVTSQNGGIRHFGLMPTQPNAPPNFELYFRPFWAKASINLMLALDVNLESSPHTVSPRQK